MATVIDRQTLVISVNLNTMTLINTPSEIQVPVNLRFAADELIFKWLSYKAVAANGDTDDVVQIWCNVTNDGIIGSFPNNSAVNQGPDAHFTLNNTFQTGYLVFQFQQTAAYNPPFYYNPQPLISAQNPSHTRGILSFTIEFVKYLK